VRFVSNAVAIVVAIIAIATTAPDVVLPWHPFSSFGFFVNGSNRVIQVIPGSSAESNGVRSADEIDFGTTDLEGRRYVSSEWTVAPPGTRVTFGMRRDGRVRRVGLVSQPVDRNLAENASIILLIVAVEAAILLALVLVLARPSALTWSFFIYSCCSGVASLLLLENVGDTTFWIVSSGNNIAWALRAPALLTFALFFPKTEVAGWRVQILRYVLPAVTLLLLAGAVLPGWVPGSVLLYSLAQWLATLCFVAAIVVFAITYKHGTGPERARLSWVMLSALVAFGGKWFVDLLWELGFPAKDWVLLSNLGYSLQILFVLAVAYAVVKHRVIDVRFFLSRTIVFSLLTVFLVLVLRTIDWFLTVIIAGERFAVLLEFAAAVGLGLILHGLQTRLEHFTSRWLFRSRYVAGQRLRRVSAGLVHAESMEPVCEMVVNEPAEALSLASCALFLRDESGSFTRRGSFGWDGAGLCRISPDDATMLQLIGSFEPLRLRDVHDDLFDGFDADRKPVLALAIHAGGRLRGALFAGAHASGEDLDRTEVALLADVAAAAGHAFDHVEAAALQRRVDELEEALRRASPQPNV
jgi:hypothetical protein